MRLLCVHLLQPSWLEDDSTATTVIFDKQQVCETFFDFMSLVPTCLRPPDF
jgi:hypothetical protein